MKKFLIAAGILLAAVLLIWNWQSSSVSTETPATAEEINLINPLGPTVVPVAGMSSGQVEGNAAVSVNYWKTIDEAIALLTGEEADFAVLPITTAANFYAQNLDITLLGVHEWKAFYLLAQKDLQFDSWESASGKEIYTPVSRGTTVDVLLRTALNEAGLIPDNDVKIFYAPAQEIITLFAEGKVDYAALPEPFVSLGIKKGEGHIVLDFQQYWSDLTGMSARLPVAGLFVREEFRQKHPQECREVIDLFTASTDWSNNNVDLALEQVKEILPIPTPIMKNALSRMEFEFIPSSECQDEVHTFIAKMKELYPEGNQSLPDKGFYAR